jgi:hypothetical protein
MQVKIEKPHQRNDSVVKSPVRNTREGQRTAGEAIRYEFGLALAAVV